jgi:hypothetical protein
LVNFIVFLRVLFFANAAEKQRFDLGNQPCWTDDDMSTMNCVNLREIFNGFINAKKRRTSDCPIRKGNRHMGNG